MKYILTDKHATEAAKALYEYLAEVMIDRRLLFGHQNSNLIAVTNRTDSDVRQLTGSLPAIVGLDTLALTGFESTMASPEAAFRKTMEVSERALEEGCLLALTAHMPNFSESGIVKTEDGAYDFSACDFVDTRYKGNDCAREILPGGKYEPVFHAYLDLIVRYAKELEKHNAAFLFRPWHDSNRDWTWWGSDIAPETAIRLYRVTREYLEAAGVHNAIYVYAPHGPFSGKAEYTERYPGDDYVDILALDMYDHYHYKEKYHASFFDELYASCDLVEELAVESGKLAAIAEIGLRIAKDSEETDMNGILEYNNPVRGKGWYKTIAKIAVQHGMPYYMLWGNYDVKNAYVPYVREEGDLHELAYDFIEMYYWEPVMFADKVKFL